jgi:hypothetical protein
MKIQPAQPQLLKHGKPLDFGVYDDLIPHPSTTFWDDEGFPVKRRRTQRKTWIFFGVYSEQLFAGLAIVDAGLVATAFAYFYEPFTGLFVEDKITMPFGFGNSFNPSLKDEWKLGKYRIATNDNVMNIRYSGKFELNIDAVFNEKGISVVAPSPGRPFNFTYKNLPLPVKVNVQHNGRALTAEGDFGAIDFTKGFPPRSTEWNWTSFIGHTESGRSIAVNLVDKFNGNMENILWLDGERFLLSKADFIPGKPLDKAEWSISTVEGSLKMIFSPKGVRSENLNAGLMKSIFTQPFGKYEGELNINGRIEKFTAWGVAEDHLAVW